MSTNSLFCETNPTYQFQDQQSSRRATRPKRKRSSGNSLPDPKTWDDVNQRLGYLGEIDRQLRSLRDDFEQKVAVLKQQWLESARPIEQERQRVQGQVEQFYWARREELDSQGRKSVELAFGRMGARLSRSVVVDDAAAAQQWLEAHGLERFLRMRTEIDREAIRSTLLSSTGLGTAVSHALLACPAIRFEETEQFWCTLIDSPVESVPPESAGSPGHWRRPGQSDGRLKTRREPRRSSHPETALPKAANAASGGIHE